MSVPILNVIEHAILRNFQLKILNNFDEIGCNVNVNFYDT